MTFAALAQSRLALALSFTGGTIWLTGSQVLHLEALLMALAAVNYQVAHSFSEQRLRIMASLASVQTAEAARAIERAAHEERVHDIRAALFVIRGAAEMLHTHFDDLDSDTVSTLAQALATEVASIQVLTASQPSQPVQGFRLRSILDPLLLCEEQGGTEVARAIDDITVLGRPADVAEVVRNLLDNVRRHAPGSTVRVRASAEQGEARVSVEDRGPGIPVAERQLVLERGRRGSRATSTDGTGLGLYVASRIVRQQGGRLWIEETAGGGTTVAFTLPLVTLPVDVLVLPDTLAELGTDTEHRNT
jgi:signal transduction histidine kinase